jgi:hypothetical protein
MFMFRTPAVSAPVQEIMCERMQLRHGITMPALRLKNKYLQSMM